MEIKELNALISLIDDPDTSVYDHVRNQIVALGAEIIPRLENVWELNSFGHAHRDRIEDIIHVIQFDAVHGALDAWSQKGATDLFEGALLIAKYQYPDLDEDESHRLLNKLRQDIWLELNDELTAFEKVKVINHILYDVYGYRGNRKNYHAAQNSYLNRVLESKKGNPLSLSVIYLVLADRLGVPIYGVNLPNHFVLTYLDEHDTLRFLPNEKDGDTESKPLFYINAFNGGSIVHVNEIHSYLRQLGIEAEAKYYTPCDNRTIAMRLLNNLIFAYERLGYPDKSEELKRLHTAVARHADSGAQNAEDGQP